MSQKKKTNLKFNLGDREEVRLVEEFKILKSYSFSRNDEDKNGFIGHIHYGDIHTTFLSTINSKTTIPKLKNNLNISNDDYLKEGDIIIADASEDYNDLGKSIYIDDIKEVKLISGLHTFSLRPKKLNKINSIYFKFYTQSKTYKKIMKKIGTGTSVFGITKSNLLNLKIPSCDVKTQNKIADFLSSIDILIEKQEGYIDKLQLKKKTEIKKIYNNYEKLEKITNTIIKNSEKNKNNLITYVNSISNTKGFISQEEQFEKREVASLNKSNYYIVRKNIIAYNPSRIDVGSIAIKEDYKTAVISPLYISFYVNEKYNKYFIFHFFTTDIFKKQMYSLFEGSVRNTLSWDSLKYINIPKIDTNKQNKIANLLSSMDILIELNQEKLEQLKLKKKYYLNEIFG